MGYVLALPEAMCDILLKCLIHILKAQDISSWKIQEKVELIKNNILQFWTKYPKTDTVIDAATSKTIACR